MFFLLVFPSSTSGVVGVCLFLWASSKLIKNETKTWSGPRNNGLFWQVETEDLIGFKSVGVGQLFWPNMGWNGAACNKIVKAEASQKSRDLFFSVVCQPHRQCKILVFLKRSLCCFHCCVPNFTERLCFSSSFVCWQAPFHAVRLRSKRWWVSFEEPVVQLSRFLLKLFRFRSLCRGLCWVLCQKILSKISRSSGPHARGAGPYRMITCAHLVCTVCHQHVLWVWDRASHAIQLKKAWLTNRRGDAGLKYALLSSHDYIFEHFLAWSIMFILFQWSNYWSNSCIMVNYYVYIYNNLPTFNEAVLGYLLYIYLLY